MESEQVEQEIFALLNNFPGMCHFIGSMPEEKILEAESRLGVSFPPDYRWFCKYFGSGSFGSHEIYGVVRGEATAIPSVIFANENARAVGTPPNILLIFNGDEYQCAIDLVKTDIPCPVIIWYVGHQLSKQPRELIASSFLSFFIDVIKLEISWDDLE